MITDGTNIDDRYEVGRLIAKGGMADVFEAYDRRLGRAVAVKVLRLADQTERSRFESEIRILAQLLHPGLVQMYDAGEHDGDAYVILELLPGPTLNEVLRDEAPMPLERIASIGACLADALAHAHAHDVIHRDVKPANILFDHERQPRLADFGVARLAGATRHTATATTIGTAAYMAPEQVEGRAISGAADVYSLALVLLEGITGERAFPGPSHEAAIHRLTRDPEVPEGLPSEWTSLLTAMCQRDPELRPSASEVAERLSALADVRAHSATKVLATSEPRTRLLPTLDSVGPPAERPAATPVAPTQLDPFVAEAEELPDPDDRVDVARRRPSVLVGLGAIAAVALVSAAAGHADAGTPLRAAQVSFTPPPSECEVVEQDQTELSAEIERLDQRYAITRAEDRRADIAKERAKVAKEKKKADDRSKQVCRE